MRKEAIVPLQDAVKTLISWLPIFKAKSSVRLVLDSDTKKRTLDQNSRLWKMFEHFGWEKDEAHDFCCKKFLPPIERELPDGTIVEIMRGTSGLTTGQMAEFQDRIERFLNEHGLWFPPEV